MSSQISQSSGDEVGRYGETVIKFGSMHAQDQSSITNIGRYEVNIQSNDLPILNPSTLSGGVNKNFIGREEILHMLTTTFFDLDCSNVERRFVISGIPGVGKSELCRKFALEHKSRYWAVFRVDCKDTATIKQSFKRIGNLCGVPEPDTEHVKDFLSSKPRSQRWLLIFDGADDPKCKYWDYFPLAIEHDIIITTRNSVLYRKFPVIGNHSLDLLTAVQARSLLLLAANITEDYGDAEEDAATELVDQLGKHTLAIRLAGSFIQWAECEVKDYLKLYYQRPSILLGDERGQEYDDDEFNDNLSKTFEISAEKMESLKGRGTRAAADALELLSDLSFMHNEVPLEAIVASAASFCVQDRVPGPLDVTEVQVENVGQYCALGEAAGGLNLRCKGAIRTLESVSLITLREIHREIIITMHPLIHTWAKHRMTHKARSQAWLRAASLLTLSVSTTPKYEPIVVALRLQVEACTCRGFETFAMEARSQGVMVVLFELAKDLDNYSKQRSILSTLMDVLNELTRTQSIDAFSRSEIELAYGYALSNTGATKDGIQSMERVVSQRETYLEEPDPDLCKWQVLLALCYFRDGQFSEASRRFERVLHLHEALLAQNPQQRLRVKTMLADAYHLDHQAGLSISILQDVVKDLIEISSEDYEQILSALESLAAAYAETGQISSSVGIFERIVDVKAKIRPKEHPYLLGSQLELGRAYMAEGQTQKGLELVQYVLKTNEELGLGNSAQLLWMKYSLGEGFLKSNRADEAIGMMEEVVIALEKQFHQKHPHLLDPLYVLAEAYQEAGNSEKAKVTYERYVEIKASTQQNPDNDQKAGVSG